VTPVDDLLRRMKDTAGSRFNAHKRLERQDRTLTFGTAFVSAYVIALTILPYFIHIQKNYIDIIGLLTVLFSIFIIISTLVQFSGSYSVLAEQHHRCALEINEIRSEFFIMKEIITNDEIVKFQDRYNSVLQKYSINHENVDYDMYRLSRQNEFSYLTLSDMIRMHISLCVSEFWLPSIIVVITAGFVWALYFLTTLPADEPKQSMQTNCSSISTETHQSPLLATPPYFCAPCTCRN